MYTQNVRTNACNNNRAGRYKQGPCPITPIQRVTHFSTGLHNGDTRGAGITLQEREGKKGKRKGGGEDAWSG